MRKIISFILMPLMGISLLACGSSAQGGKNGAVSSGSEITEAVSAAEAAGAVVEVEDEEDSAGQEISGKNSRVVVVFFSCTGSTRSVAEKIASVTGGDLQEIVPARPYTPDDLNYNDSKSRTSIEQSDKSVRPEIANTIENWDAYTLVFLGHPIWMGEEPRIMDTFAERYSFAGKTVIPFCTSGGSGVGSSASNMAALADTGDWKAGTRFSGDASEEDIRAFVHQFDLPDAGGSEGEKSMRIKVSDQNRELYFTLYDSELSRTLTEQLPLILELTEYSDHEKYVQTPKKLTKDADYERACPAGSLGYFEPWNNLCFFYGEAPAYPGQYLIGLCEQDASEMEALTGTVTIESAE